MITLAIGLTFYILEASGPGVAVFLLLAMILDGIWLITWAQSE